jgi:signal transduction histidine kinase
MHYDDRLATVLRTRADGSRASHTQFRQLVDLMGAPGAIRDGALHDAAIKRLASLSTSLDIATRETILADPALRLNDPGLVAMLAECEPRIAARVLARAQLDGQEWEKLLPDLPVHARGMLRHRRDLPPEAVRMLERLGIGDLTLPVPHAAQTAVEQAKLETTPVFDLRPEAVIEDDAINPLLEAQDEQPPIGGIAAIVARIEAFRKTRENPVSQDAPRLPLGDAEGETGPRTIRFATDAEGRITRAPESLLPMLAGTALFDLAGNAAMARDFAARQPVRGVTIVMRGAKSVAGDWLLDAQPRFSTQNGRFTGYHGRLRRPTFETATPQQDAAPAEPQLLRQALHELRTPVNAIQGFAEIIHQQLYGPAPNTYRALAAGIAGDAARMLAGFEELERLVKLQSADMDLGDGSADLRQTAMRTVEQLRPALLPRNAGVDLAPGKGAITVKLAQDELDRLVWRVLAALVAAIGPGEVLDIGFATAGQQAEVTIDLPASLAGADNIFASSVTSGSQAVSASLFGTGFALRLARAEAAAAGGLLARSDSGDALVLRLPVLTGTAAPHTDTRGSQVE